MLRAYTGAYQHINHFLSVSFFYCRDKCQYTGWAKSACARVRSRVRARAEVKHRSCTDVLGLFA